MAAFSLRLDLDEEVNRHFLEKDYTTVTYHFYFCRFELSSKSLYAKEIWANSQCWAKSNRLKHEFSKQS